MAATEMVPFESSDGVVTLPVEVDATNEEVWLSADRMSTLFDRDASVIRRHIRNIFNEKELVEVLTCIFCTLLERIGQQHSTASTSSFR